MLNKEIPNIYKEATKRAIELNLPFALFALPGSDEYRFYASRPDEDDYNAVNDSITTCDSFFITRFAQPIGGGSMIKAELSAEEVVALPSDTEPWPGPELTARPTSTSDANYYAQIRTFRHAIGRRKVTKAVLSRRIVAESTLDPFDLASRYFDLCPGTFRALYFTQETGLWLTATPELLLSAHKDSDDDSPVAFETMSLAGTRVPSPDASWDEKNRLEHLTVLDFIRDIFTNEGLQPEVHEAELVPFGGIEHLCHRITASGHCNVFNLIDRMSPTPALGGYPADAAIKLISDTELHNRYCYGGVVGVISENDLRAYVNLRCVLLSPDLSAKGGMKLNIFAGGGIMKDSNPKREWVEAASKAMPLFSIISPDDPEVIKHIPAGWADLK